ncbi:MAG: phage tail tape measure protein [Muribaculaceae bacterium]|nr:phage tail tape measure protein [Muribaculaceae bacterium]
MPDINTKATVGIELNTQPVGRKIAELETKLDKLNEKKRQFEAAGDQKGLVKIQKEIDKVSRQLDTARTASERCKAALAKLNEASPKELRHTLKQLKADLDHMERGSAAWNRHVEAIKRVKAEIKSVDAELREHEGLLSRINRKVNEWGMSIASAAAAFTGLVFTARQAVQAYADMDAEMANVRKFTGMTADEVDKLNEAFKGMDTRTSREDLNKLAQEAGRLGLQSQEDVLGFVKAADQINVALDDLGEGATLTLSKLTDIFGARDQYGVEQSMLKVGSVINELSQSCTASAPYIADFSQRLAGTGASAKLSLQEIMAYGAVLDSTGQQLEMSASAVSQVVMKLFQDPAKVAKATGMDVQQFTNTLKTSTNDALVMLLERLNELGSEQGMLALAPVFAALNMDGVRVSGVLNALANNVDMVKNKQLLANKAFKEGTSVTKEYNVQNNTVQANLDKAKKGFHEMAVELGQKLAPAMKYAITGTSAMMRVLSATISFISEYAGTIISTATAIGVYTAYVNAAVIADQLKVFWNNVLVASFKRLWAVIAANPWGAVIAALGVVIGLIIDHNRGLTEAKAAEEALNDVRDQARKKIVDEQTELEILIAAANDTTQSYKNQKAAVDKLNKTIPGFNGKIDATTRAFSYSKQALDDYINSLIRLYEVEGAKEKFKELGKERAGYVMEKKKLEKEIEEEKKRQAKDYKDMRENPYTPGVSPEDQAGITFGRIVGNKAALSSLESRLDSVNRKLKYTDAAMEALKDEYGEDWYKQDTGKPKTPTSNITPTGGSGGGGGSHGGSGGSTFTPPDEKAERKAEAERKKKEREARAAQRKKEQDAAKAKRLADRVAKQEYQQALKDTVEDRAKAETEALQLYKSGELGYYEYLDRMAKIEEEFWNSRLDTYEAFGKAEGDEYAKDAKKLEEAKTKHEQQMTQIQITAAQQRRDQAKLDAEMEFYNPDNKEAFHNQQWLNDRRAKLELDYLQEVMKIHKEGSKEWLDAEKALDKAVKEEELRQRKQMEQNLSAWLYIYSQQGAKVRMDAELLVAKQLYDQKLLKEEEYQEARAAIEKKYRDEVNSKTGTKAKNQDFDDAKDTYEQQMKALEDARKQGLISQEDYESRKFQIIQNYHNKIVELIKGQGSEWATMVATLVESWKAGFEDLGSTLPEKLKSIADMASAAFAIMNAGVKSYTEYANASRDLELAKVEKNYKAQIDAAGNNDKKKKKLEEQKEKEIAKIKSKYNKQAMVIEMAQAVASTAMAAINAYASAAQVPMIGYILGPIAAGLALAAGALQIATIKKSHQAQQMGYYEGGFTSRDGNNRREAGVVHANEFVANHNAVSNPQLLPVLRLIDQAQRNNTVGSLTSEDVSRAIGQGAILGDMTVAQQRTAEQHDTSMVMVAASMERQTDAINELNARLADGIESFMIMDGERGFDRSWQHYQRMKNNPKR